MKKLSNIICTALPWLFFWGGKVLGQAAWGVTAAIISMAILCGVARHRMKAPDWTQLLFFGLVLAGLLIPALAWILKYQAVLAPALFTVMAFGSLLFRHPFTIAYAHEEVPPHFWNDSGFPPHFLRVNRILTWLWSSVFALSLACAWLAMTHALAMNWIFQVLPSLAFVLATLATRIFPPWYQKNFYEPGLLRPESGLKPAGTPSA